MVTCGLQLINRTCIEKDSKKASTTDSESMYMEVQKHNVSSGVPGLVITMAAPSRN